MASDYAYIDSPDYVDGLSFAYMETYSFQRGYEYKLQHGEQLKELDALNARKRRGKPLTDEQKAKYELLEVLLNRIQYLTDRAGNFHPSSKRTSVFGWEHDSAIELLHLLKTPAVDVVDRMCAPVYRDGIVFYDSSGSIASVLNVCLSCRYMETAPFAFVRADESVYDKLEDFFRRIDHSLDGDEH